MAVRCVTVDPESALQISVRELWRQNSQTLGFFPDGAFKEYARRGWIIAALNDNGTLVGYLAYRLTRRRAVLVHLCVAEKYRAWGYHAILFEEFLHMTKDKSQVLLGVSATCRADFPAARIWKKLGFDLAGNRPARASGKTLEIWWYDFDRPNLFTLSSSPHLVVIDSMVFFDIADSTETQHEESVALMGDWLADKYRFFITPELKREIKRSHDNVKKISGLDLASQFELTNANAFETNNLLSQINNLLGLPRKPSERSDHKQLAHAIAYNATYFVTRDSRLLKHRDILHEKFNITVLRPSQLIILYDKELRPEAYEPCRLDGSHIDIRLMQHNELDNIINQFISYSQGESKDNLRKILTEAMTNTKNYTINVVISMDNQYVGLVIVNSCAAESYEIKTIRVAPVPLSTILAWHLVWYLVNDAVKQGAYAIHFTDRYAHVDIVEALAEIGFIQDGATWHKITLRSAINCDSITSELTRLCESGICSLSTIDKLSNLIDTLLLTRRVASMHRLEKLVWPAQVSDSGVPCFVVPIKAHWAEELFDTVAKDTNLFPGDPSKLLKFENAYYRSGHSRIIRPFSRVLWYTSYSKAHSRAKRLCAVSLINEVLMAEPKLLYKRYKRYGVYQWKDVARLSKNAAGKAMAFTFSHTYLLPKPISHSDAIASFNARSVKHNNFQSPLRLKENDWIDLYLMGFPEDQRV